MICYLINANHVAISSQQNIQVLLLHVYTLSANLAE